MLPLYVKYQKKHDISPLLLYSRLLSGFSPSLKKNILKILGDSVASTLRRPPPKRETDFN